MPTHNDSQKVYKKMSGENQPRVLRKHPAFALTVWIVFTFVIQAEKKALHDSFRGILCIQWIHTPMQSCFEREFTKHLSIGLNV